MQVVIKFICSSLLIALSLSNGCDTEPSHPSDNILTETFRLHESDFDKLAAMSNEDSSVIRVADTFTWLENSTRWPRPDSELGFSKERWDEYRQLFRKLGIKKGITRHKEFKGAVFLMASTWGNVGGGSEKGYAYIPIEPALLVESLDVIPKVEEYTPVYKKLKGNWYLYYMWAG